MNRIKLQGGPMDGLETNIAELLQYWIYQEPIEEGIEFTTRQVPLKRLFVYHYYEISSEKFGDCQIYRYRGRK